MVAGLINYSSLLTASSYHAGWGWNKHRMSHHLQSLFNFKP